MRVGSNDLLKKAVEEQASGFRAPVEPEGVLVQVVQVVQVVEVVLRGGVVQCAGEPALSDADGPDLEHTLDQLLEAITAHAGGVLNDDMAVLIGRVDDKFLTRAVRR